MSLILVMAAKKECCVHNKGEHMEQHIDEPLCDGWQSMKDCEKCPNRAQCWTKNKGINEKYLDVHADGNPKP